MIKKLMAAFIISICYLACTNGPKNQVKNVDDTVVPPQFEKYRSYIKDARFKVYLKMGMQKVAVKDTVHNRDSMLLGEMNLRFADCREIKAPEYAGLLVELAFAFNDGMVFYPNSPHFASGVFYRKKKLDDWFFAYGELGMIGFDLPRHIDTAVIVQYLHKGGKLNAWFTKAIENSLLIEK